ncbi:hypothetical protein PVAND_000494 [Polypedilum vanderplanki]|uniref:Odorant receptor n=1 Tax=Polypedilum vanderplanki TaxID=319348 RepID=A0A9J6BKG8_POLVA|nr:hypothetical protein PVAND_000494 [Polypedilum vanderplanki]
MKLSEKLRNLISQVKSYFVNDQVRMFVLFIDDFFPSEKLFGLFGLQLLNQINDVTIQKLQDRKRKFFWLIIAISSFSLATIFLNFLFSIGSREKFEEFMEDSAWISGIGFILLKVFYLCCWKRDTIKKLIDRLDQNFPHSSCEQLKFGVHKHQQNLNLLYRIKMTAYVLVWFEFTFLSLLTFGLKSLKVDLLMPIYFPLDPLQPLLYPIFLILQAWTLLVVFLILTATDLLLYGLINVIAMELDVLAQKLRQIESESDENAEKKLQGIIDGYNELADITPLKVFLIFKYAPALILVLMQLFCNCYYGELLQNFSLRFADDAYNSKWCGQRLKYRKMILLTMLRAQEPLKLTGMKFMDIGLPIFYWALQTAHSYYSLLSGMYNN